MIPAFRFHRLRFEFRALGSLSFPAHQSGNIVRGAFGILFREAACEADCEEAKTCSRRGECAYARVFEPRAAGEGPSGLADWPRPFVFRAAHLDGITVRADERFHFDMHLFAVPDPAAGYYTRAFERLAETGIGPGRVRAVLERVSEEPMVLGFGAEACPRVSVKFATPTELKSDGDRSPRPEFAVLFARLRDRISTLSALYGDGPLAVDFRALGERAAEVGMTHCQVTMVEAERHSSRTGQRHPIGGFVGEAVYEGALDEFVPYLRIGQWTGVGRQTVWGKGAIEISA